MSARALLIAAALLATAGCGLGDVAAAPPPPAAALAITTVTLTPANGKPHIYKVEIARTDPEQARGLMFRTKMARGAGMIFPMRPPRFASFWMENTYLPLDIVFIAADGRVLNVGKGVPLSRATVDSVAPAAAVLELNGGEAARIGLEPGDAVSGVY